MGFRKANETWLRNLLGDQFPICDLAVRLSELLTLWVKLLAHRINRSEYGIQFSLTLAAPWQSGMSHAKSLHSGP